MDFNELVKHRYSCRKYKPPNIDDEKIEEIIDIARLAPSAVNFQPWHFIVVNDPEIKKQLDAVYSRDWFKTAPAAIIVCGDHNTAWKRKDGKDHTDVDAAIATDHITLKAAEMGLASCWVCNFDVSICKEVLQIPDEIEPVVILPIGYPDDDPNKQHYQRKELKEVIHWNK
jgi:nitroreductase